MIRAVRRPLSLLLLAGVLGTAGTAHAQVTLTLSSWVPPTHPLTIAQADWCAEVSKATEGRVLCKVLPKPVASPPATLDAVRDGLADVAFSTHGYTPGRYVLTKIAEFPFLGASVTANSVAYQRIYEKYLSGFNEHDGLHVITMFTHGPGVILNNKRPIRTLADMDGLKFRVGGGMVNDIGKALGANMILKPAPQSYELLSSGNVAGIEIENTTDSTVRRNHAHDNTAGLLIFNLPGLPVKDGKRCNAYENIIENNNLPNFAEDGTIVSEVPYGVGAFILASDGNEFHNNTVRGNDSTGIAMVSYNLDLLPSYDDPAFDRYCQGNHVHDNTFEGNGTDPDVLALVLAGNMTPPLPDIVDDGCTDPDLMVMGDAMANCIGDNGGAAYFWAAMCGGSSSADPMEVGAACSHSSLPDVPE